jgi:hypothetical protein
MFIVQWLLAKFKSVFQLSVVCRFGLIAILLSAATAWSVDDRDLWLPSSMKNLESAFRKAALAVEDTERCTRVVSGELKQSTAHTTPIFRLLCKDSEQQTFVAMVNSVTLDITYPNTIIIPPEDPQEILAKKIQAMNEKMEGCEEMLLSKTRFMKNMKRYDAVLPSEESLAAGDANLIVNFDSKSLQGKTLYYESICHINIDAPLTLKLRGRKP